MGTMEKKKQRCESLRYSREKQTRVGEEREKKREREKERDRSEAGLRRCVEERPKDQPRKTFQRLCVCELEYEHVPFFCFALSQKFHCFLCHIVLSIIFFLFKFFYIISILNFQNTPLY